MKLLIFFLSLASYSGAFAQVPANYQDLSAAQKQEILWQNISANAYSVMPALDYRGGPTLKQIFFSGIANSFTSPTDEIVSGRSKIIHKWGSAVSVDFVPEAGHPYTGIFASGAKGIARMSLALPYKTGEDFVPGLAVKFLVDGQPSRNITVMEKLEGQGHDTNYFKSNFTNILPNPDKGATKFGTFAFEQFVEDAIHLDVAHVASVSADGKAVAAPKAPYQLILIPARGLSTSSSSPDFRSELAKIPAGKLLYEVWGKERNTGASPIQKIGALVSTSAFIAGAYEDETLYFQHAGTEVKSGVVVDWINGK